MMGSNVQELKAIFEPPRMASQRSNETMKSGINVANTTDEANSDYSGSDIDEEVAAQMQQVEISKDNVGSVENDQDLLSLLASVQPTPSAQTFCFGSKKAETSSEQDRKSMVSNTVETTEAPIAVPVIRRDSIPSLEDIMNCYKSELKEFENIVAAIEEGISENPPPELAQHINNEFKMMFNTITELHNEGIQSLKSRYPAACDNSMVKLDIKMLERNAKSLLVKLDRGIQTTKQLAEGQC